MYKLIAKTGKRFKIPDGYDYILKDFKSFYGLGNLLTYSFKGKYRVAITCSDAGNLMEFVRCSDKYEHLDIEIYSDGQVIDTVQMYYPYVSVADNIRDIDVFKNMIAERNLYIEKEAMYKLFQSIEHEPEVMKDTLDMLLAEFGQYTQINKEKLSGVVILSDVVYPRSVLLSYLYHERWRQSKLQKCLDVMNSDVIAGAMRKNIRTLMSQKIAYLKTGKGSNLIKSIDTINLIQMYRVLCVELYKFNDVRILMDIYEGGLLEYDFLQRGSN